MAFRGQLSNGHERDFGVRSTMVFSSGRASEPEKWPLLFPNALPARPVTHDW
jgi:hypothetical protein